MCGVSDVDTLAAGVEAAKCRSAKEESCFL